jgi:TMEM175 potassium channel family protein
VEGVAPEREPAIRISETGRVEAFSDGVMAIAITLLVLDLHVPSATEAQAAGSLLAALIHNWAAYVAYLAGFLTIGIIWLNHRAFVDKVRRFDNTMQWLNLLLLLGVATVPFPTALLAEHVADGGEAASTAAAVYALLGVVLPLPWIVIWRHLSRHTDLFEPGYGAAEARSEFRRAIVGPVIFLVLIPVALVAPLVALAAFVGLSVLYAITSQGVAAAPRS